MTQSLNNAALDTLFRQARTHNAWLKKPVSDKTLRELYGLLRWGPTIANGLPMRVVFLRAPKAKVRSRPALMPGNVEKTMTAPVSAIVAYDELFYEKMPVLFPHYLSAAIQR